MLGTLSGMSCYYDTDWVPGSAKLNMTRTRVKDRVRMSTRSRIGIFKNYQKPKKLVAPFDRGKSLGLLLI